VAAVLANSAAAVPIRKQVRIMDLLCRNPVDSAAARPTRVTKVTPQRRCARGPS